MMRPTTIPAAPSSDAADGLALPMVHLRGELLARGMDDRKIRRLVKAGVLRRIRRGAFVTADGWDDLDGPARHAVVTRAVLRQANTRLVVSHTSSIREWEGPTWGFELTDVEATRVDRKAGRREAGVRQHRGKLLPEDVVERNGIPVTSAVRTLIDISTTGLTEPVLAVWDDFLHRRLVTEAEIHTRYARDAESADPMDHWPHTLTTDLLLRIADGRRESVGESRTWFACWQHQLPLPEPQVEILDETGKVFARVDFAWPELGVWLEFDGKVKYTEFLREGETVVDAVLREKRRESDIARLTGWRCIRITWADLADPAKLTAMIAAELARGPR